MAFNPEIYVMDADGTNQVRLTRDSGVDLVPAWSPLLSPTIVEAVSWGQVKARFPGIFQDLSRHHLHWIGADLVVYREQGEPVGQCLADQHAIKGIAMQAR